MTSLLTGIHHVTALAKDPNENLAFYTQLLGQRLVKRTVNFDDPYTYHLYYGNAAGSPGTLLTHFPNPLTKLGVHGEPEIRDSLLSIPKGSMDFWRDRLTAANVSFEEQTHFGQPRLVFDDPHSMRFGLIETDSRDDIQLHDAPGIAADKAITGVEGVVVRLPEIDTIRTFLVEVLGFVEITADAGRAWLSLGNDRPGERIELVQVAESRPSIMGAGTVHHVAWRVPDEQVQAQVGAQLRKAGIAITPVMDRQYFRSIYCRIPGGVIFEIATDGPGFDVDESRETLGEALKLPPQYESRRNELEQHLVPLTPQTATS